MAGRAPALCRGFGLKGRARVMELWPWVLALSVAILLVLGWWLLQVTEGVLIGPRLVRWFYDRDAERYEAIKGFDPVEERDFLALPLFHRLDETAGPAAWVLDVATGTGRLPAALFAIPFFEGSVVGVDASPGMLAVGGRRLAERAGRYPRLLATVPPLPFADASFDAVCLMEALEFLPDRAGALAELVRVLAPGGFLLVSNRSGWERRLFLGHAESPTGFEARLAGLGLVEIRTQPWQAYYDLVWARKPGDLPLRPAGSADDWFRILRCQRCGRSGAWRSEAREITCEGCGQTLMTDTSGNWAFVPKA